MGLFTKERFGDASLPKDDRGTGSLDDYAFDLIPRNARITMRLEDATPHQDELREIQRDAEGELTTITPARTTAEDGADAPIEVRIFLGRRVSGVIGRVPRGLESVFDEAVRRLDGRGDKPRIPLEIVSTRQGLRVELKMGQTK